MHAGVSHESSALIADLSLLRKCLVLSINVCIKMIIFIYVLHQNLSAKTYADEPTFALLRLLRLGGSDSQDCNETCRSGQCVCVTRVCVCLHNSDLQHLLVDAIMAVGAEVGLVLVLSELSHSAQVTRSAGFRVQYQTLSQQPERTPDRPAFNFSYWDKGQKQRPESRKHTQPSCRT